MCGSTRSFRCIAARYAVGGGPGGKSAYRKGKMLRPDHLSLFLVWKLLHGVYDGDDDNWRHLGAR